MTARLICSRCHRPLAKAAATLAGMPLGPTCARAIIGAVADRPTRVSRAAQREAAEARRFLAAQADLFTGAPALTRGD